MERRKFYEVYDYHDKLEHGKEIKIEHSISFRQDRADLSPYVCLSQSELSVMLEQSRAKEEEIFKELQQAVQKWEEQAGQTILCTKSLEYVRTRAVSHTANVWCDRETGQHEISNMVYKMWWRSHIGTRYSKNLDKTIPIYWELSWSLSYNAPDNSDHGYYNREIAGQSRKRFSTEAEMEKYLQGRIKAYSHLFTEISPPVPKGQEDHFSVNGILLPGYTVEVPEPTPQEVADSLLDLLDDEDLGLHEQPEEAEPPVPPPQPSPAPPRRHIPKSAQAHKPKRSAPTR